MGGFLVIGFLVTIFLLFHALLALSIVIPSVILSNIWLFKIPIMSPIVVFLNIFTPISYMFLLLWYTGYWGHVWHYNPYFDFYKNFGIPVTIYGLVVGFLLSIGSCSWRFFQNKTNSYLYVGITISFVFVLISLVLLTIELSFIYYISLFYADAH